MSTNKELKKLMALKKKFETTEKKEFEESYEEVVKMRQASRICDGLFPNLLFTADHKLARFYVYVILRDEKERNMALKNSALFKCIRRSTDEK